MCVLSNVVADIDGLSLIHMVWGNQLDAAASIKDFLRLQEFHWAAMGLASPVGWLPYRSLTAPSLLVSNLLTLNYCGQIIQ